jgi:hypothetical protein
MDTDKPGDFYRESLQPRFALFFRLLKAFSPYELAKGLKELRGERTPLKLEAADEAKLIVLTPPSKTYPFIYLGLRLYADGQEYNLPGDEEVESEFDENGLLYTICASPEDPPFIVASARLEAIDPDSLPQTFDAAKYLADLSRSGQQPRYLSDGEADSVALAVEATIARISH